MHSLECDNIVLVALPLSYSLMNKKLSRLEYPIKTLFLSPFGISIGGVVFMDHIPLRPNDSQTGL